jgi:hypothetical protein
MKHALACLPLCLFVLAIFSSPLFAAESEEKRLIQFFKTYLDEAFRRRPLEATRLGDHRYDHLLDDISAKARAGWVVRPLAAIPGTRKRWP